MKCEICNDRQAEIGYNVCKLCSVENFYRKKREVVVTFQAMKLDSKFGEPFTLSFLTEDDLERYIGWKANHPYMSMEIISKVYKDDNEYLC